jgi:hypothetical protein
MAILTTPLDPCPYSEYLTDPNTDPALSKNLIFFPDPIPQPSYRYYQYFYKTLAVTFLLWACIVVKGRSGLCFSAPLSALVLVFQ